MMALRPHICDLQHRLARDLLLDVQIEILHVRRPDVLLEAESIALKIASRGWREYRGTGYDRACRRGLRENWIWSHIVISWAGIKIGRIWQVGQNHVLREGVEEQAVSGAEHRFPLPSNIPCHADAGGTIPVVRLIKVDQPALSHLGECEGSAPCGRSFARDVAEQIVLLADHAEVVPAQPIVQSQPWGDAIIVLQVEAVAPFGCVAERVPEILKTAVHVACEEILQWSRVGIQPTSFEIQHPAEVLVKVLLNGRAVKIETKLEIVSVHLPGKIVKHLVVAVHTVPRNAARRAKLCVPADIHDRQTRVCGPGIQANRAGLKTLVCGEKSLGEPVPADP